MKIWLIARLLACLALVVLTKNCDARAVPLLQDDFARPVTWEMPTQESVSKSLSQWMNAIDTQPDLKRQAIESINSEFASSKNEILDLTLNAMVIVQPALNDVRESLQSQRQNDKPPTFSHWLEDTNKPLFVRNNVRLYLARWLAQNEFYDESLAQLEKLSVLDVVDPATLLFYRGLMQHQLLKQDACLDTIQQLLEHDEKLPRRFGVLGKLMAADIEPMEADSLDEIARLMNDIRRRTGLHRSGQTVRDQEQDVISKLDKLIEEMESQQQQMQASNSPPSNPMEDSKNAPGAGDGEVTRKAQKDGGDWGNLPPAQRSAALAEMAKDMPPHYRSVIEEYFRQLANDEDQ